MKLATHVRTLGSGQGRARSLTKAEAADAMAHMLDDDADPHAVGALLMLLRMKGEVAEEISGFVEAILGSFSQLPPVDLDWPSYSSGRTRGLPWFLLSARLVAEAGYRVCLHGWNGADMTVRDGLNSAGIKCARTFHDTDLALRSNGIVYLPLELLSPRLKQLLDLRSVLGLRSCLNTVARMLNPAQARASVQGVFHPSYRSLQSDAAALLGWTSLTVIKGGGGEFERHPGKALQAVGLREGQAWEERFNQQVDITARLAEGVQPQSSLATIWNGITRDPFAEATILGTASLALDTLGVSNSAAYAAELWAKRDRAFAV